MIRKLCDRVSRGSTPFRVIMKQWILVKFLCDRVYFSAILYATGYRVLSGLPHTPVTSLVKYPPPPPPGRRTTEVLFSKQPLMLPFLYHKSATTCQIDSNNVSNSKLKRELWSCIKSEIIESKAPPQQPHIRGTGIMGHPVDM